MLTQPLLEKLTRLRLPGFREGLKEQWENPHYAELTFEERLGLLVDLEPALAVRARVHPQGQQRERAPHQGRSVCSARHHRGSGSLSRSRSGSELILELAQGEWFRRHLNILMLGPTGAGKSYLACALGQAAC